MPSKTKNIKSEAGEKLTELQKRFCQLYVQYGNAEQAYRDAYNTNATRRVSPDTAALLRQPKIQAEIARIQAPILEKIGITQERTLEAIARVAFADIRQIFAKGGTPLSPAELPDEIAAAIAEISITETVAGTVYKYKLNDRCKAQDMLGRHFGMYKPEEVSVTGRVIVKFE